MSIRHQLETCAKQYSIWKELALKAKTMEELKMCLKKAIFWMELQTAFVTLWSVEQVRGDEPEVRQNIITAKSNLSKRLADYAEEVLNEINRQ
jgi:phage-related protein